MCGYSKNKSRVYVVNKDFTCKFSAAFKKVNHFLCFENNTVRFN